MSCYNLFENFYASVIVRETYELLFISHFIVRSYTLDFLTCSLSDHTPYCCKEI